MVVIPAMVTYDSVVSYASMHVALTIAPVNVLRVITADILDAYIIAPN